MDDEAEDQPLEPPILEWEVFGDSLLEGDTAAGSSGGLDQHLL